ncbi:MAG: class III signal peptide-containing protein [Candidatus Micrarchaeota archaeon]
MFKIFYLIKYKLKKMNDGHDRGQVSAEMLVLTAAIIAIAFILITQLQTTAVKSAAVVSNKTDQILESINALP